MTGKLWQEIKKGHLFLWGVGLLIADSLMAQAILVNWNTYILTIEILLQLICIICGSCMFLLSWFTWHRHGVNKHILGLGFFLAAIINATLFFPFLGLTTYPGGGDTAELVAGGVISLTEAISLFLCTLRYSGQKCTNRWLMLLLVVIAPSLLFLDLRYTPLLVSKIAPLAKTIADFSGLLVIGLYFITLFRLREKLHSPHQMGKYLFLAIVLSIPAQLFFLGCPPPTSYQFLLGCLLRGTYYYLLARGLMVTAVVNPYETAEASRRDLAELFDALPLGLMKFDPDLRLRYLNAVGEELLGYGEADLKGLTSSQIANLVYPPGSNIRLVQEAETTGANIRDRLLAVNTRNGHRLKLKINVYRLSKGGCYVLFTDARQEQELRNLELQTKTILNATSNLVMILDRDKRIISTNRAFDNILQINGQTLIGSEVAVLANMCKARNCQVGGNELNTVVVTTGLGNEKELLLNVSPVYDVDGEKVGTIIVGVDVTLMSKETQRVNQREKLAMLGQMAAGIVHEIRNPITTILGFGQMIASQAEEPEIREFASIIETTAKEVNVIVSDFLTFAKPHPPEKRDITVEELISGLVPVLEKIALASEASLRVSIQDGQRMISVDQNQIRQVIFNMVKNAVEALEDTANPSIDICSTYNDVTNELCLAIIDNGKGISKEEIAKIGTPFFTTKDRGTGLGMSISFQIIHEHGGRIVVSSEVGKGSKFQVYLPAYPPTTGSEEPANTYDPGLAHLA